jgi:hypothetical protein
MGVQLEALTTKFIEEPGSSVSIVSDYGQGERGSMPGRGKGFFL